ncbi:MAG: GNAT family N-acetyltransferase [Planctomycetes bacterium]|nr:GNAT family N-acetyltransferase [Planctomycetota bacterium]
MTFRDELRVSDRQAIESIVRSTGFFHAYEVDVALELVDDRLAKGGTSDYHFLVDDEGETPRGYACYGRIACTAASFDLYWIAVHRDARDRGLGRLLLGDVERRVRALGGKSIWVETSSRPLYVPTRAFYERCDYQECARLPAFYDEGDDKVVFVKHL